MESEHSWFEREKFVHMLDKVSMVLKSPGIIAASEASCGSDVVQILQKMLAEGKLREALHLRETAILSAGSSGLAVIADNAFSSPFIKYCSEQPTRLVDLYGELTDELKIVKIDLAMSYCRLIREVLLKAPDLLKQAKLTEVEMSEFLYLKKLEEVETNYRRLMEQDRQINTQDYWDETQVDQQRGSNLSYKKMPNGTLKTLTNMRTQVNLFNFLALVNEIDLYPTWIPFCKKSDIFKNMSDFCKAVVVDFNIGKFLFAREMCIIAFAWDRLLHKGSVAIECKSIHPVDLEIT
jgi:hypothetical protein